MAQFPSLTLTEAGIEMIAASQGGSELIFTRMKMGDGDSAGVEIMELEDLLAPKITINISSIDTSGTPGQVSLTATVNNAELDNGFFTKELGVFAKIGDNGVERLYAYTNAGSYADYMTSKATPIDENTIRATMVVANNANTTAIINSSVVFLTAAEVDAKIATHDENREAHPQGLTAPLMIWESGEIYKVNDVRVHEKKIWMCIEGNSDVVFDKAKWENIGGDNAEYTKTIDAPMFNERDFITVSGDYTAPVTGWYKITVKGGGGGGGHAIKKGSNISEGGGGGEGGTSIRYKKIVKDSIIPVVIGGGGLKGSTYNIDGTDGGNSSVTVADDIIIAHGGKAGKGVYGGAGGNGDIYGHNGYNGDSTYGSSGAAGSGGGTGGGIDGVNAVANSGAGGCGSYIPNSGSGVLGSNGADGFVLFEYFDESLN